MSPAGNRKPSGQPRPKPGLFSSRLSFLSRRFSFKDRTASFFDTGFFGDLSGMEPPGSVFEPVSLHRLWLLPPSARAPEQHLSAGWTEPERRPDRRRIGRVRLEHRSAAAARLRAQGDPARRCSIDRTGLAGNNHDGSSGKCSEEASGLHGATT